MSKPNKAAFSIVSEQVGSLFGYDKRISALEQLCKDQRYCIARKVDCRNCPLWECDKEKQCRVLNPDRMITLGLIEVSE